MTGQMAYTTEEKRLPKMKCTYGLIKHSHHRPEAPEDPENGLGMGKPNAPICLPPIRGAT